MNRTKNKHPRYGFKRKTEIPAQLLRLKSFEYQIRKNWRKIRISRIITSLFGAQYKRSRDLIEIDITYRCNLKCYNCNRSTRQAPSNLDISIDQINQFVNESIEKGIIWKRIRILGGEPTLHPHFLEIIKSLERYLSFNHDSELQVVTNGFDEKTNKILNNLPDHIWIENSRKSTPRQLSFAPFNVAPRDLRAYKNTDYSNGCAILEDCGMGLTPQGYYPCAISGGIDRIMIKNIGYTSCPDVNDDMKYLLEEFCQYCGRFTDGHYIPKNMRPQLEGEFISESWSILYTKWKQKQQ